MKINKFKKVGKNKYKVIFDNTELTLFEDIILKYELLTRKDIDVDLIDKIIEENRWYEAYDMALSYIEIKMRNKREIIKYLERKMYDEKIINNVIHKLEELNLLNEKNYIRAYINDKVNLSNEGPYKIKNELLELDFNENDIDDYLSTIEDSIWEEKLVKILNKKKNLMKNKSYYMFMNKMKNDLFNLGYDKYMIDEQLSNINYESDAIIKDYEKYKRKYKDDNTKIINSLLRKGYSYEEIKSRINE